MIQLYFSNQTLVIDVFKVHQDNEIFVAKAMMLETLISLLQFFVQEYYISGIEVARERGSNCCYFSHKKDVVLEPLVTKGSRTRCFFMDSENENLNNQCK